MTGLRFETDEECRVVSPCFDEGRLLALVLDENAMSLTLEARSGARWRLALGQLRRSFHQALDPRGLLEGLYFGSVETIFTRNEPLSLRLAEILSLSSDEHVGDASGLILYGSPLIACEFAALFDGIAIEPLA